MKKYKVNNKQTLMIIATFIVGILLATYIKTFDSENVYITLSQAKELEEEVNDLNKEVNKLKEVKKEYEKSLDTYKEIYKNKGTIEELIQKEIEQLKIITGDKDIEDEGIILTIKDSENDLKEGQDPNDLIVHDIDILRIINDLKKAGAIAISINGERILQQSQIKCAGSTIKVNDITYGQPFVIKAIGDIENLKSTILNPQSYINLLESVYGIYINFEQKDSIIINSFKK